MDGAPGSGRDWIRRLLKGAGEVGAGADKDGTFQVERMHGWPPHTDGPLTRERGRAVWVPLPG